MLDEILLLLYNLDRISIDQYLILLLDIFETATRLKHSKLKLFREKNHKQIINNKLFQHVRNFFV